MNEQLNIIIFDLLIDVRAGQLALNKFISEYVAKDPSDAVHIQQNLETETKKARKFLIDAIFVEYGDVPDELQKILTRKS